MCFYMNHFGFLGYCWPKTNVKRGTIGSSTYAGERSVNPVGRERQAGGIEIGCGKAQLLSQVFPVNHPAGNGVGPSQHLTDRVKVAGADEFPDAGAAHDLIVQRNRGKPMDVETEFSAELFE